MITKKNMESILSENLSYLNKNRRLGIFIAVPFDGKRESYDQMVDECNHFCIKRGAYVRTTQIYEKDQWLFKIHLLLTPIKNFVGQTQWKSTWVLLKTM